MWCFLLLLPILVQLAFAATKTVMWFLLLLPALVQPAVAVTKIAMWFFPLFLPIVPLFRPSPPQPAARRPASVPVPPVSTARVNKEATIEPESSRDPRTAGSWTGFPSASGIIRVVQKVYLESTRVVGTIRTIVAPESSPPDGSAAEAHLPSTPHVTGTNQASVSPAPSLPNVTMAETHPSAPHATGENQAPVLPAPSPPDVSAAEAHLSSAPLVTGPIQASVVPRLSPSDLWKTAIGYEKGMQEYVPRLLGNVTEYLPSAVPSRVTGAIQSFVAAQPSPSDFWGIAKGYEKNLQDYVPRLLGDAAAHFKSTRFTDVTSSMHHIVSATATFRSNIKGTLDARHIPFDTVTEELGRMFAATMKDLHKFPLPDQVAGHAERATMVQNVLGSTTLALTNFAAHHGIEEAVVTAYLHALTPHVQTLVIAVGDINEQYPHLLPVLQFSVTSLLMPETWILKPFLSMLGFGPLGPIKGSAAAWMQRRFWGAAVSPGSWFSMLQAAGMGAYPRWGGLVTSAPLLVKSVLPTVIRRFTRG